MLLIIQTNILIPILIFCVLAVLLFSAYYFSSKKVIIRTLSKIKEKSVGSVKTNELIKVTGKALHVKEPLVAPLSKRKCIFYTIKIEQHRSSGKHSYWKTLIEEEKFQDFFVESRGEYVIVKPIQHPKNYIAYLVSDKDANSGTFNDPTPEFESLLKQYNIDSKNFLGINKRLRYKEGIIAIGERITVAGIAQWKQLSEPIADYSYSKIVTLEPGIKQKIIITDLPLEDNQHLQ